MARKKLSDEEIKHALIVSSGWNAENENLRRRFEFKNFAESLAFINRVGVLAEQQNHHPDITFGWGYAEFFITTHDAGGVTERDFQLVKEIDKII